MFSICLLTCGKINKSILQNQKKAELSVAIFVKVNNIETLLATKKVQDETGNVLIFLAALLLVVEKCVYSLGWLLWVEGRLMTGLYK